MRGEQSKVLYANEVERATRALEEDARLRQKVSASLEDYIQGLKDSKKIKQTIARNEKIALKLEEKLKDALASKDATAIEAAKGRNYDAKDLAWAIYNMKNVKTAAFSNPEG